MAKKNGATPSYSVTSAGVNPAEDRTHRMHMYFISMSLRVVCVASLFWVRGWWVVIPVLGSIFLPWFAVMIGNAKANGGEESVSTYAPPQIEQAPAEEQPADPGLLIVDVDPVRRTSDFEFGDSVAADDVSAGDAADRDRDRDGHEEAAGGCNDE